ncbi:hypothetical protein MLD38_018707 [Melastoma candidum]|nr:hypothetical protein MLD38_018707 [Melastoma candidum]
MKILKLLPDSATYSVLIRLLCQRREYERAEEIFDELSKKEIVLTESGCTPLVAAYNPIFEYLCKNGKTKKAEMVFRQLMKRGVQDPPSFITLIMGNCREGNCEAAYELLVLMLRRDYMPDFETYQTLMDGFLRRKNSLYAYNTLLKMLKSSYHPRSSTYHLILSDLIKGDHVNEAADLLILMLEKLVRQNMDLSTQVVRLLFSHGKRLKAIEVVKLLYKNNYAIGIEELVSFLYQRGKLLDAGELLLFGLRNNSRLDIDLCNTIIRGLSARKRLIEAFSVVYELVERERHQNLTCMTGLASALQADGKFVEAEFVRKRIPSTLV